MVDLTILQPISWFAASIGVCVAAAYYIMNLRTQQKNINATLETRQADILQRYLQIGTSKEYTEAWYDLVFWQNFLTIQEWREKYGFQNPEHYTKLAAMLNYYDTLGGLLRKGLVSLDLLMSMQQPLHLVCVWERLEPVVKGFRITYKDESIYGNIEYLFTQYMEHHPKMALTKEVWHEHTLRRHEGENPHVPDQRII
jgi:hypothetical protein